MATKDSKIFTRTPRNQPKKVEGGAMFCLAKFAIRRDPTGPKT